MLKFDTQMKLEQCLEQNGFKYDLSIEDQLYFNSHYGNFVSVTLRSVTGLLNHKILGEDTLHSSYDIEMINKIAKCLVDSGDDDLMAIAWNSFIDCAYDERFVLYAEMKEARNSYFNELEDSYDTNHTKILESDRLVIRPNNKEDGRSMFEYVNQFDPDEYAFARMARNNSADDYFIFSIFLKETGEIVGDIGLIFDMNQEGTFNLSYYIKKEHRRKGYTKEAFEVLHDAIQKNEIILYGQWKREYVLEETKPVIKLMRIELDENNIASFNTAKALGFDYEGKILRQRRIHDEDCFFFEHHFVKRILG